MLPLLPPGSPCTLLCLGAHADDIEIGALGLILRLLKERPGTRVHWVVMSGSEIRRQEARRSAEQLLGSAAAHIEIAEFRDGFFPEERGRIKEVFERLKPAKPDLILTHARDDRHQDHRIISDLTWQTFRSHLVLEYEVPKYDGDLGQPNLFVPVPEPIRRRKIDALLEAFPSQSGKPWFSAETFQGLMRLRGVECASPTGYAEAFYARKVTFLG